MAPSIADGVPRGTTLGGTPAPRFGPISPGLEWLQLTSGLLKLAAPTIIHPLAAKPGRQPSTSCLLYMPRGEHILRVETFIPRPREEVFAFFAAAENLEQITPPELRFEISTPLPIHMAAGTEIEYRLRLFGVPFSWLTVISDWEPGVRFVDQQVKGPYALWVHTHSFADAPGGTRVRDEVRYRLPLFPLGEIGLPLVRRQLQRIFGFRTRRLEQLLGVAAGA